MFMLTTYYILLQQNTDSICAWVNQNFLLLNNLECCYSLYSLQGNLLQFSFAIATVFQRHHFIAAFVFCTAISHILAELLFDLSFPHNYTCTEDTFESPFPKTYQHYLSEARKFISIWSIESSITILIHNFFYLSTVWPSRSTLA